MRAVSDVAVPVRRRRPPVGGPTGWLLSLGLNGALGVLSVLPFFALVADLGHVAGLWESLWDPGEGGLAGSLFLNGVVLLFFLGVTMFLHVVFRMPARAFWIFSTVVLFTPFVTLLAMPGLALLTFG